VIDEEPELRERFAQLRAEERRGIPPFNLQARGRLQRLAWRPLAAAVVFLLVVIAAVILRPRPTTFSASDRAAVRSVAAWHPPTDFLMQTPGSEMLTTTPRIPDLKGIPQ
jgi:hypothetical protein